MWVKFLVPKLESPRMLATTIKAATLGLALALTTAIQAQAEPVKIGSKNFTEQFIVAEIYAQALEKAGIAVQKRLNLGATQQGTPA